ncbi:MOSC domain-containing protein [Arthrobacter sp. ISL-69]|uniref:MOSC domain-containing protein n=1 Tax=Arthrobacter sp. ISL-69 TaxID=2819113 RepID=UPI001BE90788|nr:MOSC domain-containing protein [Arthrobacter sp. ISL-69]MBT2534792.1 MOSC domain-containing protein [Arthrobacter sp. ISL-69]
MTASYRYDVEVLHLLVSPAHAYFGRAREGAADVPTTDADHVELVAGKGIVGDRFFGKAAHMDAAVTLIAVEALEAMAAELGTGPFDPLLTRRNVVLRGAHLAPLLGGEFALESRGDLVRLRAGRPAHPCAWMDEMLAPGAHKAMRGRGGVRCQPLSDGILHRGPAVLISPVPLDPESAGTPALLHPSRLP